MLQEGAYPLTKKIMDCLPADALLQFRGFARKRAGIWLTATAAGGIHRGRNRRAALVSLARQTPFRFKSSMVS